MALDYAWLGQGLAVDLVNTYVPAQNADLLAEWPGLSQWRSDTRSASELRVLATTVIEHLLGGTGIPDPLRRQVSDISQGDPERVTLTPDLRRHAVSELAGAVARDLIRLIVDRVVLRRCGAPGCGMVYVQTRASQRWCSNSCGNRARVARHSMRTRHSKSLPAVPD